MLVATMVKEVPEYRIAAADESPRQIEIGTFKPVKTKKVIKRTALTIYFILLFHIILFCCVCFCTFIHTILNKVQDHAHGTNGYEGPEDPFRPV